MALMASRRNLVLGVLLLATLAVSAWTLLQDADDGGVVAPTARAAKAGSAGGASRAGAAAATGPLVLQPRPAATRPAVNLFGSYSYQAPAAAAAAPVVPVQHAPPFPFQYTGRMDIDGHTYYLFLQGDVPLSIAVGSIVGDFTLVEAAGDRLVFVHGPTAERVTMNVTAPTN